MPSVQAETLEDPVLIERCIGGDSDAWEALVYRYRRLIFSIPLRGGLNSDDAADVFQTVCSQLLGHLHSLRDRDRLAGWLATTARRETNRLRRLQLRTVSLQPDDPDAPELEIVDPRKLPDDELLDYERAHDVRSAVESLQPRCKQLVEMLFYTDDPPSYEEVSRRLSMPVASIGPTRARCIEKLRMLMSEEGC